MTEPFSMIPIWVQRNKTLTSNDRSILSTLRGHCTKEPLKTFISNATLAEETATSISTVRRSVARLEQLGIITVERDSGRYVNTYYLHMEKPDSVEPAKHRPAQREHVQSEHVQSEHVQSDTPPIQVEHTTVQSDTPPIQVEQRSISFSSKSFGSRSSVVNTPVAPKGQDTEQPTFGANEDSIEDNPVESTPIDQPASLKPYDDGEYTPDFEMFWAMYPLHQDKRQAFKAYKRARRRASAMVIAAGAQKYAHDPNLPEPRYIKHAATWLNADGWANDPLPSRTSASGNSNRAESTFNNAVNIAKHFYEQEYGSAPQDTNLLGGLQ